MRHPALLASLLLACSPDDATIPVAADPASAGPGCDPNALAWTLWVANQGRGVDTVDVIHPHTDGTVHVVAQIPVGRAPHALAITPDRRLAYVANLGSPLASGVVSVIDTASFQVVATVPAGVEPHGVTVTPDGRFAWIANIGGDDLTIIDTATQQPAGHPMPAGGGPAEIAFSPDGEKAYVSNGDDGTVSVIDVDARRMVKTLPTGRGSMGIAARHDGRLVFESEPTDGHVSVIDTASDTVVNRLAMAQPHGLALAGDTLLVTNASAGSLALYDARSLSPLGAVEIPGRPQMVAVAPDCRTAYATLQDAPSVAVVDLVARRLLSTIDLGEGSVHGIAVVPEYP